MPTSKVSQKGVVLQYFKDNPNRDIPTAEVVDVVVQEYLRLTGKPLRDPDRAIRTLHSESRLIKVSDGIYRYEPGYVRMSDSLKVEFTQSEKEEILKAGYYRCAICGATEEQGAVLHIDHIRPRSKGGDASIENGQVLCSQHNNLKKNYSQTETCKRVFIQMQNRAVDLQDSEMRNFVRDVLVVFDRYGIDTHIQ